jgi:acetyl-CoA carboxylase biotin carboxyl carrier protein
MDIREIQNLIKFVAKSGATEVKLEMDDFKITIKTTEAGATEAFLNQPTQQFVPQIAQPFVAQPQPIPVVATAPVTPASTDDDSKYVIIKSPTLNPYATAKLCAIKINLSANAVSAAGDKKLLILIEGLL